MWIRLTFILFILNIPFCTFAGDSYNTYTRYQTIQLDTNQIQDLIAKGFESCADDYSNSLYFLDKAEKMSKQLDYFQGVGDCNYIRSWVYYYRNDYKISLEYLNKAKRIYQDIGSEKGMAKYYLGLGRLENLYGNYINSIKAYQKALKFQQKSNNIREESNILNFLATVNLDIKNHKIALQYVKKALKLKYKIGNKKELSNTLSITGTILMDMDSLNEAEKYYKQALKIREELADKRRIAGSLHALSIIYNLKKEPEKAKQNLTEAYKIFKNLDEKTGEVICLLEKSKSNLMLGLKKDSEESLKKAMKTAVATKNNRLIKDCFEQYSKFHTKTHDYHKAYIYLEKYTNLKDSLENIEKIKVFDDLEIKYQSEKKDSEIELLKNKNELQKKNIIILGLASIILLILSILLFYFYKNKSQKLQIQNKLFENEQTIHKQQLKLKEKEAILLKHKLESKNRELTSKVLNMLMINKMLDNIVSKLKNLNNTHGNLSKSTKKISSIIKEIENHSGEELWEDFNKVFQGVHSDFYNKLLELNPNLTSAEIKMASLLKLNLSTKEIAAIIFKSESSIKTTRFRLRKKLGLSGNQSLISFMIKL